MKLVFRLICLILSVLGAASVHAQDKPLLTICAYDFPPYHIKDGTQLASGKIGHGLDIDILTEVLSRCGYNHKIEWVPFARLKVMLTDEKSHNIVTNTFFYKDNMPAGNQVLYDLGGETVFYKHGDDPRQFTAIENLKGLKIGVVLGDWYGFDFQRLHEGGHFETEEVRTDKQNFLKLTAKRVDLLAINSQVGSYLASEMASEISVKEAKLKFSYGVDPKTGGIYTIFSRKTAPEIIESFRRKLLEILKDGTYKQIKSSYGVADTPYIYKYYGITPSD